MSQPGGTGKAIPSLAKKSDQSKASGQKLKFVPTLPPRRVKLDASTDPAPGPSSNQAAPTRGGSGRGRGRGNVSRPTFEMKASGPFAMGPSLVGSSRRPAPRSNFTPIMPSGLSKGGILGSGLTQTTAPTLGAKKEQNTEGDVKVESEEEVYSEPDEGVEIVDMNDIRKMDWMAPDTLKRESEHRRKLNVKKDKGKPPAGQAGLEDMDIDKPAVDDVDLANAVNLSESEDEVEEERVAGDFFGNLDSDVDPDSRQEKVYFFQFPLNFPTFIPLSSIATEQPIPVADKGKGKAVDLPKKVTFVTPDGPGSGTATPNIKPDDPAAAKIPDPPVDGIIGQLEMYRSGGIKMRLTNGILLDVSAATQPSFLQQAIYVDEQRKKLCVLGEVNRRFIVTPDIGALLVDLSVDNEQELPGLGGDGLIVMDTS